MRTASRSANLDPRLVLAVIRTESGFRPAVSSKRGARGLMQIMPETGKWLWPQVYPNAAFSPSALFDPVVNIHLGVFYLGLLAKRYHGNLSLALAAYNGGGVNVQKWLESGKRRQRTFLQSVSYPETKDFVIKVWVTYVLYRILYPGSA